MLLAIVFSFTGEKLILHKKIYIQGNYFTTDNLGACYLVDGDEMTKYDENGTVFKKFSIKAFGKIESIDASNPLKVLLYYKDFAKIIYLDNTLSLNGNPIDLEDVELTQASLACSSHDNGIWLYNQQKFEILRLDQNLKTAQQSGNLNQLLGVDIQPNFLCEYNNSVYLNNPKTGILVFDIFGTYVKTIPIPSLKNFQVSNNAIYFLRDNKMVAYDLKITEETEQSLIENNYKELRTEKGALYLKSDEVIDIFHVK